MKLKSSILAIALTSLISAQFLYAGGGWPKKRGKFYVKLSGWFLEADSAFTTDGTTNDFPLSSQLSNLNVYAEYGITDRLTAVASIPFYYRASRNRLVQVNNGERTVSPFNPGLENETFGDTQLGFKYGIYKNALLSLSLGYTIDLPLGDEGEPVLGGFFGEGATAEAVFVNEPATGDGELNHIIKADLGISIYNSKAISLYGNVYTGINIRSRDFSEELRLGVEAGVGFFDSKLWVVTKLDTIQSLQNGDRPTTGDGSGGIFLNNIEVTSLSPEISYKFFKNIGVSAGASIPLSGELVFSDPSYSAGIFIDVN